MFRRVLPIAMLVVSHAVSAQRAVAPTSLSLDDALAQAKRNNPTYLQSQNARARSSAQLRSAYGTLIPSVSTSAGLGLREGRQQFFAGQAFGSNQNTYSSSVGASAQLNVSAGALMGLRSAQSSYDASDRDVDNALLTLRLNVTQQYMNTQQATALVTLQDTLLASAKSQYDLAFARARAGQVTDLDVKRAEVQVGQAEVAALQARNSAEVNLLRLFQLLGIPQPDGVLLTTNLPVALPTDSLGILVDRALRASPAAVAQHLREDAASRQLSAVRGSYFPSLSLSGSLSLAGQKTDTGSLTALNRQPYSVNLGLSLPLFDGFQREQNVANANANRRDAEYAVRALELKLTADVTAAFRTLLADYRTVDIQKKNAIVARQALDLAEQRYRLGLASLVDFVQARADFERASNDQINATYTFHRDFAALENAVGRPLR